MYGQDETKRPSLKHTKKAVHNTYNPSQEYLNIKTRKTKKRHTSVQAFSCENSGLNQV
jgi:hypothetical protein